MTLEKFTDIINTHKEFFEKVHSLYEVGVDMLESKYELNTPFYKIFDHLLTCEYSDEGVEWISWFIYESEYGERDWSDRPTYIINEKGNMEVTESPRKYGAHDENDNPICYDIKSLHEYIEANCKIKTKCSKKCSGNCGCQR